MIVKLLSEENKEATTVRKIGTSTMCRYAAACWNAFYEGKQLKQVRAVSESKQGPIVLLGTPFTAWKNAQNS